MAFDPETFIDSKLGDSTIRENGPVLSLSFDRSLPKRGPARVRGVKRVATDKFEYGRFREINRIHTEYIRGAIRGTDSIKTALSKAELTGAWLRIQGRDEGGYVVQERKNSLLVIFSDDRIRLFPKETSVFVYELDGVEYYFYGSEMKKARVVK